MTNYIFELFQSNKDFQYYWRIKSSYNGQIITSSSEGFATKQNCKENFELLWYAIKNETIDLNQYRY
jgi:uncharacterized protein YegP (UPF0339 family)